LSYESLKTRKRRIFLSTSYIQGQEVQQAQEAIESARAGLSQKRKEKRKTKEGGLSPQEGDVEKKEKKKTKEGKKVAPAKARFRVPLTKNFFFGSRVFGF
jgi:hypothetical protein